MNKYSALREQRLLRLNTPAEGIAALPEPVSAVVAGINWTNVLLVGGAVVLGIGAARYAMRKLFGNA